MGKKNDEVVAFFAALCLFMAAVEYAIPKPLPFLRLGLTNLPVLLALSKLSARQILLLVLVKTVGQGVVSGTLFSYVFLFSAAGSFASAFGMMAMYFAFVRIRSRPLVGFVGISLTGALCNNLAQLLVARFVLFGEGSRLIAPLLFVSGAITGLLLGVFAEMFAQKSKWYASIGLFPTADVAKVRAEHTEAE